MKKWKMLFIVFLFSTIVYGQQRIKVHSIGTSLSQNKTPNQALAEAILDSKKNAMIQAGISEKLTVTRLLYQKNSKDNTENYFNEISTIESSASIVVDSIYSVKKTFDQFGNMVVSVELDATIFKYSRDKDQTLFFKVEGLKDLYYENEYIDFSFVPSQNGYLTIFVFNENETFLLYPFENLDHDYLSDKKERLFNKDIKVLFPINEAYKPGYSIEMNSDEKEEISGIIYVFTKKYIPWINSNISRKSVLHWVYNIPLNQRELFIKNIVLKPIE